MFPKSTKLDGKLKANWLFRTLLSESKSFLNDPVSEKNTKISIIVLNKKMTEKKTKLKMNMLEIYFLIFVCCVFGRWGRRGGYCLIWFSTLQACRSMI